LVIPHEIRDAAGSMTRGHGRVMCFCQVLSSLPAMSVFGQVYCKLEIPMKYKAALWLSAFLYVLGFSLTPEELGSRAKTMNLRELYEAKDTVLRYEELSDSNFAKWLPTERIVESRIDSLIKSPSREDAVTLEANSVGNIGEEFTADIVRNFSVFAGLGYSGGGQYLNIVKANSGLSSISGSAGFLEFEAGARFKALNHLYLSPRLIFENSSVRTSIDSSAGGATVTTGTSESYNTLFLPGVDARYYLVEDSRNGVYLGGSAGFTSLSGGFSSLDAKATGPQLGVFAGWEMRLFSRLFGWKEHNVTGIEIGYLYIPVTVAGMTPSRDNVGGIYFALSRCLYSSNY